MAKRYLGNGMGRTEQNIFLLAACKLK
jgi:hypothetical protein